MMSRRTILLVIGILGIVGFFLATKYWANMSKYLPYLLILACPLLHLFGHGGRGSHGDKPKKRVKTKMDFPHS